MCVHADLRYALTLLFWFLAGGMCPHHSSCSNFLRLDSFPPAHLWIYYSLISATHAFLWHGTNSFLCLYHFWPSTRRFSECECSLPSPLNFVMGCSATLLHETNSFGVTLLVPSILCGLLHDVFQRVSVHPHPHWNLFRIAQVRTDSSFVWFW